MTVMNLILQMEKLLSRVVWYDLAHQSLSKEESFPILSAGADCLLLLHLRQLTDYLMFNCLSVQLGASVCSLSVIAGEL